MATVTSVLPTQTKLGCFPQLVNHNEIKFHMCRETQCYLSEEDKFLERILANDSLLTSLLSARIPEAKQVCVPVQLRKY